MNNGRHIHIRGLRVHNLKGIDLDLPLGVLIAVSGVSGSGKSSLAFDTLFAEGQRRYIETFSAYSRQFLERIDRPDADSIDNVPPTIAIRQRAASRNSRSTVGSVTELDDYLRLLFAKIGRVYCEECGEPVRSDTAPGVLEQLAALPADTAYLVAFPIDLPDRPDAELVTDSLRADGVVRILVGDRLIHLEKAPLELPGSDESLRGVVDRLVSGRAKTERVMDSIETAFLKGRGRCDVLVLTAAGDAEPAGGETRSVGGRRAHRLLRFSTQRRCARCGRNYPTPDPRLYSSNNPMGACPTCKGFGNVMHIDMDRVIPDKSKSLRAGAIAPWNTPSYAHELDELLALAADYAIPVDVPYAELSRTQRRVIERGVPERDFGGLRGFFRWLERKKYKMHIRVFLSRWRSYATCPECRGTRLQPVALATRVAGKNIAELTALEIREAARLFRELDLSEPERVVGRMMIERIRRRLEYLETVGVGYLTLNRPVRTLSGGEAQRVALTRALGAGLVNTLYVLDEPSIGLHERDTERLVRIIHALRDARNSVVVVEHDEALLRAADHLVDIGPGAGSAGGRVVYQGSPAAASQATDSVTGEFLGRRRRIPLPATRRPPERGWIRLRGARGNNLRGVDADFPLGVLCVVTGVSGSGKSTLVEDTLYAAVLERLGQPGPRPLPYDAISGVDQISDCVLLDQSPIGRTARSNPVTYVKAFEEMRRAFAATAEARTRNYTPGHFSFNADGGRCSACRGLGVQVVDMQFLADVSITCPDCRGSRFRPETLEIKYRGKTIAEVLDMPVGEALAFFRGQTRVQQRLAPLCAVGLEYLRLGQPAQTLSGGEAQRLKMASRLGSATRERTLLVLDEPTTGLHPADIVRLLDCFDALLAAGHALLIVEHNLDIIQCADWIIDLGPEAAGDGGRIVACGTPETVARVAASHTGRSLARRLETR